MINRLINMALRLHYLLVFGELKKSRKVARRNDGASSLESSSLLRSVGR